MKKLLKILFTATIILFICSCKTDRQELELSSNGYWQQLGYGKIIQIINDTVKIYDVCKAGCNLYEKTSIDEMGKIDWFTSDSLMIRKNIKTYKYVRIDRLPEDCELNNALAKSPVHNFEVLWNTFNEQYCYFEDRGIDWDEVYKTYRPTINKNTSELELYQTFEEILSSLNDGHVSLETPTHLADTLRSIKRGKLTNDSTAESDPQISTFELGSQVQAAITDLYCADLNQHNGGIAKWGMMKENVGYVQINAMLFLAYYDMPENLSFEELQPYYWGIAENRTFQRQDEIDGANKLMDTIVDQFKDARALILDLRFNVGGKDEAALGIIGHFINERLKIATKKAKLGEGFTNHQNIYLEPKTPNFLKNVYVLTSHGTSSAAELAAMATLAPGHIKRIGSNTEGIFSDGLDKRLPIGWEYTLSNEVYEDLNGNNYEAIGVPPDYTLDYPENKRDFYNLLTEQLSDKEDKAIEMVLQMERQIN